MIGIRKTLPSFRKVVMKAFAQKNSMNREEVAQTATATSITNFNILKIPFHFLYILYSWQVEKSS